jgi:hypothetical protein
MPRPADFTADFQASCDAEIALFCKLQREGQVPMRIPLAYLESPVFIEVWYAGAWLGAKLEKAGCSFERRREICFLQGRIACVEGEPWASAIRMLENYLCHTGQSRN